MTHFETEQGLSLGSTFAGDNGRTSLLVQEEADLLASLETLDTVHGSDGSVRTVDEFVQFLAESHVCSDEEHQRRWFGRPIRPLVQQFVTPSGEIVELVTKR